jgi:hypothetical protein
LIAAAPDLLEVVKHLAECGISPCEDDPKYSEAIVLVEMIHKARAAIAKAEGGAS